MKKLLLTLLLSSPVLANELTLYVIPSPGLDWSSPKSLFISAAKSRLSFTPHFMGHLWVELKCGNESELTGMTDDNADFLNQLVLKERGLGIFYHTFPGKLEQESDIQPELQNYLRDGGINFVRFSLNNDQCNRAQQYLSEYKKNNVGRHYGLAHRPRHGEGAGCSAFAVSFPDVLDVLDQEMKEAWSDQVELPFEFSGPPLRDESVSIFKVLTADKWAKDPEKRQVLSFWSPDKMYKWINDKVKSKIPGYSVLQMDKVSGVVFDKSYLPVPQGPIWLQQLDQKNKSKTAIIIKPSRPPKKN